MQHSNEFLYFVVGFSRILIMLYVGIITDFVLRIKVESICIIAYNIKLSKLSNDLLFWIYGLYLGLYSYFNESRTHRFLSFLWVAHKRLYYLDLYIIFYFPYFFYFCYLFKASRIFNDIHHIFFSRIAITRLEHIWNIWKQIKKIENFLKYDNIWHSVQMTYLKLSRENIRGMSSESSLINIPAIKKIL